MDTMNFTTKLLSYAGAKDDVHGALRTPIYANAAFEYSSSAQLEAVFSGKEAGHLYSRASNPTVEELELKVKNAVDAKGVIALASGMAAVTNTLLALLKSGDNIITTNKLFGHTISFLQTFLHDFDVGVRYADMTDREDIERNIDADTKLIFCESMSNPGLIVPDFAAVSSLCKTHGLVLIADTTMTPWTMFDAKKHGIDIEVISATKFLSGGATVVGGLIVDNGTYNWKAYTNLRPQYEKFGDNAFVKKMKKQTARNLGATLSAFNAYLLSLGLETLDLRVKKSCDNAEKIANFVQKEQGITNVVYPGLKNDRYHTLSKKQFQRYGSIVLFDFASKEKAYRFMDALRLIKRCTNIQDNKTLAIAPFHTIYAEYDTALKKAFGLREGSVRLSVGIEESKDIIQDIKTALKDIQ
ncbi:MAG: aminotransferase class V-fold PLP-dependent enzyme [Campylobacterota bacterium]